jgi:acyl carrier protein
MTRQKALEGIQTVAQTHLDWQGEVKEEDPLVEAFRLDSIRLLTLVVELENHFEIYLEDGDEEGLETIGDLVDLLLKRAP